MRQNLWINGESVGTESYRQLSNPFNGEKIADVAEAGREDVIRAIDSAAGAARKMAEMDAISVQISFGEWLN